MQEIIIISAVVALAVVLALLIRAHRKRLIAEMELLDALSAHSATDAGEADSVVDAVADAGKSEHIFHSVDSANMPGGAFACDSSSSTETAGEKVSFEDKIGKDTVVVVIPDKCKRRAERTSSDSSAAIRSSKDPVQKTLETVFKDIEVLKNERHRLQEMARHRKAVLKAAGEKTDADKTITSLNQRIAQLNTALKTRMQELKKIKKMQASGKKTVPTGTTNKKVEPAKPVKPSKKEGGRKVSVRAKTTKRAAGKTK